jgi:CRISPR-associated endonuclease/helicase Cas3
LGACALRSAGVIVSPGRVGEAGAVRSLVEAVYGAEDDVVPPALQRASREQQGKDLAHQSQAQFNALQFDKGYCADSSGHWDEDTRLPTRLGDETLTVYLAVMGEAGDPAVLQPLRAQEDHAWEQSALRLMATRLQALAPDWLQRFELGLAALRSQSRLLEGDATVLPLATGADGVLEGWVLDAQGRRKLLRYDPVLGLCG